MTWGGLGILIRFLDSALESLLFMQQEMILALRSVSCARWICLRMVMVRF